MTRERIEDMREVVLPFVKKRLLETNYEGLGKSDAEEFTRDFNEILELAIKALEQEPTTKNNCAEQNGCITCSLDDGDDCCRKLYEESMQEPTTKNDLGVDCVSRQAVLDLIADYDLSMGQVVRGIHALPSVTPKVQRWIPLTKRPMTDEEREYYREWSDVEGAMIFDCPLPEDGQEVLVSYGGYVCVDTFCKDDGCYFEGVDIDDVDAWMPLPQKYREVEE